MADEATKRLVSFNSGKTMEFLENHCQKHPETHSLVPWLTFNTTKNWGRIR